MTTFLNYYLEILKQNVLEKSGFKSIAPGDCRVISYKIFDNTKHSVSETTLKRVYGFAYSKFRPSLFTIDAMAKYCGYDGWDDFCAKQEALRANTPQPNVNWDTLKHNAAKITNFTLQALKNKSGIPYTQTIKRQFIDQHLAEFLQGDYTATVLAAPAGYGKTIALCHWVEEQLALTSAGVNNDVVLFFSSSALMNVFLSGRDLNDWMLGLLGYTTDKDLQSLIDNDGRREGNFYLIIDGLDEHSYKSEQFSLLLNQVNDVCSLHQNTNWFKLILTMRASTWVNNRHELEHNPDVWFTGFINNKNLPETNVPLFSTHEIKELCLKINPAIQNFMAIDIADNFNHPLYFQFYYKQYKDDFSLSNANHVCLYDLISTFLLNKVYMGAHSAEKILLMHALIGQLDLKAGIFEFDKLKVNSLIKQYPAAYNDLLSVGFLRELNISADLRFRTVIQFGNSNFCDVSIARDLLQKNDNIFDCKMVATINNNLTDGQKRLRVIKWCVVYAAKTGQLQNFDCLAEANLSPAQKSELLVFLGELLEKACSPVAQSEHIVQYFKKDCSDGLFNYFFGIELISAEYKKAMQTLLKFKLSNKKKILTYTSLATIAALQLDIEQLEQYLGKLKSIEAEEYLHFDINPLHCIDAIYQFFKYGVIKKGFFNDITQFVFNPPVKNGELKQPEVTDIVALIAGYGLAIGRSPRKTLRYIRTLKQVYQTYNQPSSVDRFFMEILTADSYFMLGNTEEFNNSFAILDSIYKDQADGGTPYMRSTYYSSKIKLAVLEKNYRPIAAYLKIQADISQETGIVLPRLFMAIYLQSNGDIALTDPQLQKQVQYDYNKILRDRGISAAIFVNPEVVN
ncbi:hypothetical protein [Mucilaginibacter pedocola]|uniref:Uncharacterized protein n=1 Tax=Mucilaginibacter pedocola TaxID=1792845 RepID=A0A1S9PIR1_9SPHI|nr:hypothetical protein [Mucilaginibacter pedocola]OOQ60836.1 hypothetical protein BC343_22990 [Mucilaginibacter pedocola]